MTKRATTARVWLEPETKKRIRIGAAKQGITQAEFVKRKIHAETNDDILEDFSDLKKKKKGGKFFPF